jgi:L-threonylcarbamoyladenylate synthase
VIREWKTELHGDRITDSGRFAYVPMTEVVRVDPARPNHDDISRAADCLRRGGLVAFPTETVYGLGAHALDRAAVLRLFEAKGRPANDPLIVHVPAFDEIPALVAVIPELAAPLAARFWPGPLTLVMRRAASVPLEVTAGLETVAVRVPAHPVARALLLAASIPVAAPSANLFSRPSPTRAAHVLDDLDGRIDMVVDGGPTEVGVESTVLDLTVDPPAVLRPGAVSVEMLRTVIPAVRPPRSTYAGDDEPMASPGLLSKHYAPRAPLTLYQGEPAPVHQTLIAAARDAIAAGQRVGVLATVEDTPMLSGTPVVIAELGPEQDVVAIAAGLYAALRQLDAAQVDIILMRDVSSHGDGLWRAVRDRLHRAAARIVAVD